MEREFLQPASYVIENAECNPGGFYTKNGRNLGLWRAWEAAALPLSYTRIGPVMEQGANRRWSGSNPPLDGASHCHEWPAVVNLRLHRRDQRTMTSPLSR